MDDNPVEVLDVLQSLLDKILSVLAGVGIELPAIVIQVFLLVLVLALIYLLLPKPKEWKQKPMVTIGVVALGLVAGGIFFTWIHHASVDFPDELVGRIVIDNQFVSDAYDDMHVELRDADGRKMSTGSGYVDPDEQTVFLYYEPSIGNLPRNIHVSAPLCQPTTYDSPIELTELQAGAFTRHLRCEGET